MFIICASGTAYNINRYPLRSCEPIDVPFIEAIEDY